MSNRFEELYRWIESSVENKKKKNYDHLQWRLKFIRTLTESTSLTPMIDMSSDLIGKSLDSRKVLQKKDLSFSMIMRQLDCRLLYIKSGSTGHTFRGFLNTGPGNPPLSCAIKVVPYPRRERYGTLHDVRRPENAEILMLKTLSRFVLENQTPHIVLPIATFYTSIKPFIQLGKHDMVSHKRYKEFIERYNKGDFFEHVSVLISEWANGGDLLDYVKKNYLTMKLLHWKVIFFQLISTLAIIQEDYPGFRMNDAKCNNVLVHKIESHKKNYHRYFINNKKYTVPNIGLQIKIWDHDFSCIPSLVNNSKVQAKWTDKINVKPVKHRYYDIHMFFCTLMRKGFLPEIMSAPEVHQDVKDFIDRVVPPHLREGKTVTEKGRLLKEIEYTTPAKILEDPFFDSFVTDTSSS